MSLLDDVLIISLATFSISWLLVFEDGPYKILDNMRNRFNARKDDAGQIGQILSCPVCLSVYVSVIVTLIGLLVSLKILIPLSAVGVVVLLMDR